MVDDANDQPRQRTRSREVTPTPAVSADYAAIQSLVEKRGGPYVMRKATAVPGYNQTETGIFTLDLALLGGIPEGLTSMLFGYESSGKTTLAARIVARLQRKYPDKQVVYVDTEQTYDNTWSARHGVDNDRLWLVQPTSGEEAVDIIDAILRTPDTTAMVLDSLPALVPMKESEGSAEDALVAVRARLIGRLCSKILDATNAARKIGSSPTSLLINQWRTKIGVVKGDPRVLPGGYQPKYLATTMIEVKNKEETGPNFRGVPIVLRNHHAFVLKKSKVGNSMREGEFQMIRDPDHPLGAGAIDEVDTVCGFAKKFGLITGGGSSWHIADVNKKFGKQLEIEQFFEAEPEEYVMLKRRIIMAQRRDMGLSFLPPDSYLYGWVGT